MNACYNPKRSGRSHLEFHALDPNTSNIKPVRDWSRSRAPGNSVSIICPLVHGKIVTSAKFVMCKPSAVAIDDRVSVRSILARGPNASSVTSHGHGGTIELADVMSFLPLLEAFQEFCRRALCTEVSKTMLSTHNRDAVSYDGCKDSCKSRPNTVSIHLRAPSRSMYRIVNETSLTSCILRCQSNVPSRVLNARCAIALRRASSHCTS